MEVSASTLCRVTHRHRFTGKKIQQIAKQRCAEYHGRFMAEMQFYSRKQFVWIDETGCTTKDHLCRFGYALRGHCFVHHRFLHRRKHVSAVAATCFTGLVAVEINIGTKLMMEKVFVILSMEV